jgi:hypothetical protein
MLSPHYHDVRWIVVKQIQLDHVVARLVQIELVQGVGVRADVLNVLRAMCVLEDRGLPGKQGTNRNLRVRCAIGPEWLERVKGRADSFDICVAVLHDDPCNSIWMFAGQTKADRRTIVLDEDRKPLETKMVKQQLFHDCSDVGEGVFELLRRGFIAVAKADVIRSYDVEFAGELWNEVPKHMG